VWRVIEQARYHPSFAFAKGRLAKPLKDLINGTPCGLFDLSVGVAKRHAKRARKTFPDGRLPGPHHPHQNDRFIEFLHLRFAYTGYIRSASAVWPAFDIFGLHERLGLVITRLSRECHGAKRSA
jgi:hypothetical protein